MRGRGIWGWGGLLLAAATCAVGLAWGAAAPRERLEKLAAEVAAGEDLSAIKHLQRAYGFYVDKGMWEDLAQLFTDDAVANYPAGTFIGKTSIREHLYRNVGGRGMELGLGDGRLYNHMSIQPVVHLEPGGQIARGRWRVIAMFGQYGGGATWAEGIYEMTYAKDKGVWKIKNLDYYSGFGAPYKTGWVAPATQPAASASTRPRRNLAHAPDRPRQVACEGFPAACIAPFHYENPGHAGAAPAWKVTPAMIHRLPKGDAAQLAGELLQRATRLRDEQQLENLQRIYGYYVDRAMWDQVADLFADQGTMEIGQSGVYVGKAHIRQFLGLQGGQGLATGQMNDHLQMQILVDVAPDGKTARSRSRELGMTGWYREEGTLSEGVYENTFVKENGVWRIQALHFYPTFISNYEKGWAEDAQPAPGMSTALPPDRPPSQIYAIFPKAHIPPYHYRNPVTGEPPHYPPAGGPDPALAAAALMPLTPAPAAPAPDVTAALNSAEHLIERVRDYDEIENLEGAYGYYLDKNLWNPLADLFARDGSMELAQRGVYQGQAHVREFLLKVFGRGQEGPVPGRLGNHIQVQPVIDIADDGRSARIRSRMLQQMSFGPRASWGGAIYENEVEKEDGTWRFKVDHAYNTFSAAYEGGWTKGSSQGMPGPAKDFPPDAPPSAKVTMFPVVYDIPFHYANPVTGRTDVPPLRLTSAPEGMPASVAAALRDIGPKIEGPRTAALYAPQFKPEPYEGITVVRDLHYGPHERHVLDVFTSSSSPPKGRPVVVFIHGGGFSRGAKHSPNSPFYDNVGVWAARKGLVGVTINYRLAPQFPYPAGVEDLTRLVAWLKKHAAEHGGDPRRIYLWGHSAGAAHVGDYLAHQVKARKEAGIAGAILTSGFYDLGTTVSVWKDYYGEDVSKYKERSSLGDLVNTPTPLLVTSAELDPDSFQAQTRELVEAFAARGRPLQTVKLANHSHLSETYAVGTSDESLSGPVLSFITGEAGP